MADEPEVLPPPAEEVQSEVTSEEGTQIPVNYDNGYPTYVSAEGNSMATGENISPGSSLVGEDYEHDALKAHDMASTGDASRTVAAQHRRMATDVEAYRKQLDQAGDDEAARSQAAKDFHNTPYNYRDFDDKKVRKTYGESYVGREVIGAAEKGELDSKIEEYREQAVMSDEFAKKQEEWAGILHDHPISEEYLASHPLPGRQGNFGRLDHRPEWEDKTEAIINRLINSEDEAEQERKRAEYWEHEDDSFDEGRTDQRGDSSRHKLLRAIYDLQEQEAMNSAEPFKRLDELLARDSTTIGDIVELYKDLRAQEARDCRQHAAAVEAIYDDIRTGRASEPPEPAGSEQVTA